MNNDDKKIKLLDNEAPTVTNIGPPILSFPSSVSPTLIDKRTYPLLYLQPSPVPKNPNCNNNNNANNINNNESSSEPGPFNVSKLSTPPTLSNNGTTKFVQVQSPNQNIAYVGTFFKSSSTGKDVIPQKVLLTPVKGKDVSMTRYILPRPSSTSQTNISSSTKQICRSFVVSPVQNSLVTSGITVKAPEGTSKILPPNIIRQRSIEAKVLPPGTIVPGGIIVPGKSSVPPPGLTLLKSSAIQTQCGEKTPVKVVLLDMKNSNDKHNSEVSEPTVVETTEKLQVETVNRDATSSSTSEDSIEEKNKKVVLNLKSPEIEASNSNKSTENLEPAQSESILKINEKSSCETPLVPPVPLLESIVPMTSQPSSASISVKNTDSAVPIQEMASLKEKNEPTASLKEKNEPTAVSLTVSASIPIQTPPTRSKEKTPSPPREAPSSLLPIPSSGERARKRKGSLSSSVSSPSKAFCLGENYENMKLFPGAEDIDPLSVINWDSHGIGKLPESDIKVILNDFNMIELYDSEKSSESSKNDINQKNDQADEIFCCVHCGCYGLISEFFNENYCSISCRDELIAQQYAIINKKEAEVEAHDLNKDKKKIMPENSIKKLSAVIESNKSSNKPSPKLQPLIDDNDKIYEQDIEVEEVSSTETDSPPKKSYNDETRSKVKKMVNKSYKMAARKPEKSLKNSAPVTENNENKSKIKLRPRNAGKISRISVALEENIGIAQDLDVGVHSLSDKNDYTKKTSNFRWTSYLAQTKTSPAWVKLFNNPYPSKPNTFKVGHKLEAIDPEHQSYFCLVTVAAVKGYRLKLHFDGYPPEYDFWVNADSPNIFPSEFCISHKIPLHPPLSIPMKVFDWNSYLARNNARAAPPNCFENNISNSVQTNLFKVDMKLEAVDRKNTFLVCVATVAAVMESRILIHFDSWGDLYDYWVDISSPYIRPVGWCQNNNHELTPPNGIKPENFSWKKYLRDTKSIAAPEKAFTLRPPIEFKKGMKIEAVDKRAPHLIRVATIAEVLPYQVKISFDGFPPHFGYWVDDDCPDIHPVGWASRAGHPLERPPTVEDFEAVKCPTPGCVGQGYLQGTKQENHTEVENCPYATEHLSKETALTDRLKWTNSKSKRNVEEYGTIGDSDEESDEDIESIRWSWLKVRQDGTKSCKRTKEEEIYSKNDSTSVDNVSDPEEIKKIFGPSSPIPLVDLEETESSSIEIKSENDSSAFKQQKCETDNVLHDPVKCEFKEESAEVKIEPFEGFESVPNEKTNTAEENSRVVPKEVKLEVKNEVSIKKEPIEYPNSDITMDVKHESLKLLNANNVQTPPQICAINKDKTDFIKTEKNDIDINEKEKLEEKNALFWSIHQVSQFTRPLISCADDCFLKEGIDGPGFLMLSKNDLLDYLGLSDTDAERVFRKISMLRQKVCIH